MSLRKGMPASELPDVTWRKSRRSGPQGGNCVEIAHLPDGQVAIRNSRHPAGPALVFTPAEWTALAGGATTGAGAGAGSVAQTQAQAARQPYLGLWGRACGGRWPRQDHRPLLLP